MTRFVNSKIVSSTGPFLSVLVLVVTVQVALGMKRVLWELPVRCRCEQAGFTRLISRARGWPMLSANAGVAVFAPVRD